MKGGAVTITRRDSIERFSRKIELSKAQRSGNEIELALAIIWSQSRYSLTPRNRLFEILFLRCFCEDREGRERIGMLRQEFSRDLRCFANLSLLQQCGGPM